MRGEQQRQREHLKGTPKTGKNPEQEEGQKGGTRAECWGDGGAMSGRKQEPGQGGLPQPG